jgi:pimeloyl-ACP methyl ester carboxylesterase
MVLNIEESVEWGRHDDWIWNGHRCHWRHLGEKSHRPIILLHGFGTGCGHWRRNAAVLAKAGWSVYGLDLLGFGSSSQPAMKLDNRLWAQQVHGFLQQIVQEPAVLVGHSLGGLVALSCSVFFPHWVTALIASPLPDPTLLLLAPDELQGKWRRKTWWRQSRRYIITIMCNLLPLEVFIPLIIHSPLLDLAIQMAYKSNVIGDTELRRLIARPAGKPSAASALRSMSIAMALRPIRATAPSMLRRLSHPMLIIWGEDDRLVPLEVARRCQRFQQRLVVHVVPQAGHCPHDEQARTFNSLMISWLTSLEIKNRGTRENLERTRGDVS